MADRSVLVTRPLGQAESLCQHLQAQGYSPVHQPMLTIEQSPQPEPLQRQLLMNLDQYQHLIFISGNAIRCGMAWIEQFWPQLPVGLRWYTIGAASAKLLSSYGISPIHPQQMNSEGLLALPELQSLRDARVLIIKGDGGRAHLLQQLQDRGARVEELCAYQRRPPQLLAADFQEQLREHNFSAILLSSGEGLDNMMSLLGEQGAELVAQSLIVVPGERVAESAAQNGFRNIVTADNATDEAMLRALTKNCSN